MTNKEIAELIKAAGHEVPGNLNRTKLEALAKEKGVILPQDRPAGAALPAEEPLPEDGPDDHARNLMVTPSMAVSGMTGNAGDAPVLPDAGGHPAE